MTATNSDMKKVGNTFLQLKLVLDKGVKTEEVFMGKFLSTQDILVYTSLNCRAELASVLFISSRDGKSKGQS